MIRASYGFPAVHLGDFFSLRCQSWLILRHPYAVDIIFVLKAVSCRYLSEFDRRPRLDNFGVSVGIGGYACDCIPNGRFTSAISCLKAVREREKSLF